jgi:sugar O-acyltransferase (sialic acid O-acetyltransferase NeuD family)
VAKVVLFGVRDYAELAHFYLTKDSPHEVVAFSVDRDFTGGGTTFKGLPIAPFEDIQSLYPPSEVSFFAPMSPSKMNRDREARYKRIKEMGYSCISYVSSRATVFSESIGENCFILEDNTLQPFTRIGNNVVLWSGNHIGHHSTIRDHVTITSHVVVSGHCDVGDNCFIGVNATLRDGITLAEGTFVAMAAAMVASSEAWGAYKGNPATKLTVPSDRIKF